MWFKLAAIWLTFLVLKISCKFEFTNVKCTSLDKDFSDFEYCYLKSVNRSYKFISIKANLFQTPITKIKVTATVYKRYNGYRPFMVNITVDGCRFLKGAKAAPVAEYMYGFFRTYSNVNHTCPFDHDIILEKLDANFMNYQVTKVLPVPEGDYLLETHWIPYEKDRAVIKVYGTIS
ncbi:uncharacterized protein [Drosophila bipectinata]|uniref:uncharacterized protein n=1 Tax=Drosophila bipectinata TaxID=42026 RepID=UPI0007E655C9|nr:uncharacterized protein LOC108127980 [Drosophila bipectinata]